MKSEDTLLNLYIGSVVPTLYLYLNVYKTLFLNFHHWQRTIWSNEYIGEPIIVPSSGGVLMCYLGLRLQKILRNLNDSVRQEDFKKFSQLKYLNFSFFLNLISKIYLLEKQYT